MPEIVDPDLNLDTLRTSDEYQKVADEKAAATPVAKPGDPGVQVLDLEEKAPPPAKRKGRGGKPTAQAIRMVGDVLEGAAPSDAELLSEIHSTAPASGSDADLLQEIQGTPAAPLDAAAPGPASARGVAPSDDPELQATLDPSLPEKMAAGYTPPDLSAEDQKKADILRFDATNTKLNPAAAADVKRIAAATGFDTAYVAQHLAELQKTYAPQVGPPIDWHGIAKQSPGLAQWLLDDPIRHAEVKDEVGDLTTFEQLVSGRPMRMQPDGSITPGVPTLAGAVFRDAIEKAKLDLWQTVRQFAQPSEEVDQQQQVLEAIQRSNENGKSYEQNLADVQAEAAKGPPPKGAVEAYAEKQIAALKTAGADQPKDYGQLARTKAGKFLVGAVEAGPSLLGAMTAAAAGGAVAGPPGAAAAGIAYWTALTYGPLADQVERLAGPDGQKLSNDQVRQKTFLPAFAGAAALELGLGRLVARLPGAPKLLKDAGDRAAAKILVDPSFADTIGKQLLHLGEEQTAGLLGIGVQTVVNNAAADYARAAVDPTYKPDLERVIRDAVATLPGTLATLLPYSLWGAGSALVAEHGQRLEAQQNANTLRALGDTMQAAKLFKTHPRETRALIAEIKAKAGLASNEAIDAVYVTLPELQRYAQEQRVDPREFAAEIVGDGGKAYDQAVAEKAEHLAIPLDRAATFATKENGQHWNALYQDMTLKPRVNTPRQEAAYRQRLADRQKELAGVEPEKMEADHRQVFDAYREQALDAGEDGKTATANAQWYSAALKTLSEVAGRGESAWDLWQVHPLNIKGPTAELVDSPRVARPPRPESTPTTDTAPERPAPTIQEHQRAAFDEYDRHPAGRAWSYLRTGLGLDEVTAKLRAHAAAEGRIQLPPELRKKLERVQGELAKVEGDGEGPLRSRSKTKQVDVAIGRDEEGGLRVDLHEGGEVSPTARKRKLTLPDWLDPHDFLEDRPAWEWTWSALPGGPAAPRHLQLLVHRYMAQAHEAFPEVDTSRLQLGWSIGRIAAGHGGKKWDASRRSLEEWANLPESTRAETPVPESAEPRVLAGLASEARFVSHGRFQDKKKFGVAKKWLTATQAELDPARVGYLERLPAWYGEAAAEAPAAAPVKPEDAARAEALRAELAQLNEQAQGAAASAPVQPKLDFEAVAQVLGAQHELVPTEEGGLHPDELAQAVGAPSGDQLLRDMVDRADRSAWSNARAAERVLKSEPLFQEAVEDRRHAMGRIEDLPAREREVVESHIDRTDHPEKLRELLRERAGTPWAKAAINSALARGALEHLLEGRDPDFASPLDSTQSGTAGLKEAVRGGGLDAVFRFLRGNILAAPEKPGLAVNGSFLDCEPTKLCSGVCYASGGRGAFDYNIVRSELITMAVERDPARAARMVADQYRVMSDHDVGRALRLFDRGDGSTKWIPFLEEIGRYEPQLRFQIFSKRADFLSQVPEHHLRLFSVDVSNMHEYAANPAFPFAFTFTGSVAEIAWLNLHQEHVGVILPIMRRQGSGGAGGRPSIPPEALELLAPEVRQHVCPVDSGAVAIAPSIDVLDKEGRFIARYSLADRKTATENAAKAQAQAAAIGGTAREPNKQKWRCTDCDTRGGVGCFLGRTTEEVARTAGVPSAAALRSLTEEFHALERSDPELARSVSEKLADLVREARALADRRAEGGEVPAAEGAPGGDGRGPGGARGARGEGQGDVADAGRRSLPVLNGPDQQRLVDPLEELWRGEPGPLSDDKPVGRLYQEALASRPSAPVWHSAVENAIGSAKIQNDRARPDEWWQKLTSTPGVKKEELELLGLRGWLDQVKEAEKEKDPEDREDRLAALGIQQWGTYKGLITRDEILRVAQERRVGLKEKILGEVPTLDETGHKIRQHYVDLLAKQNVDAIKNADGTHEFAVVDADGGTQVLGVDDARELLDRAPRSIAPEFVSDEDGGPRYARAQLQAIAEYGSTIINLDNPHSSAEMLLVDGVPAGNTGVDPSAIAAAELHRLHGNVEKARAFLTDVAEAEKIDAGLSPLYEAYKDESGWGFRNVRTGDAYGQEASPVGGPRTRMFESEADARTAAQENSDEYLNGVRKSDRDEIAAVAKRHESALAELDALAGKKIDLWERRPDANHPQYEGYTNGGHAKGSYREILLYPAGGEGYASPHFGDHARGLMAHIRAAEHVDQDGKKTLVFLEGQADAHQAGAEQGYRDEKKVVADKATVQKWADQVGLRNKAPRGWNVANDTDMPDVSPGDLDRYNAPAEVVAAYGRLADSIHEKAVPDMPWKESWPELLVKRFLKYAADKGYERVALTPGEVHARRWGTELIAWEKASVPGAGFVVTAKEQHGGNVAGMNLEDAAVARGLVKEGAPEQVSTLQDLIEVMAAKLPRWSEDKIVKQAHRLWERMQNEEAGASAPRADFYKLLYDTKFRSILDKQLKKYGGKLEDGQIDTARLGAGMHDQGARQSVYLGSLPEKARQRIQNEGMPLFQEGRVWSALTLDHDPGSLWRKLRDVSQERMAKLEAAHPDTFESYPEWKTAKADLARANDALDSGTLSVLHQPGDGDGKGPPRGYIEIGTLGEGDPITIQLGALRDRSTLAHESFHALSFIMGKLAERADAPAGLKADYNALLLTMGYTTHAERMEAHRAGTGAANEEKGSHLWEQYLAEGKAPTRELGGTFRFLKRAMLGIYKGLQGIADQYRAKYGEALPLLTDEVRGVFDRLLATKDAIDKARREKEARPPKDLEVLTPDERAAYDRLDQEDADQAHQELIGKAAAEDKRETLEAARAESARLKDAIGQGIVAKDPAYRALALLQTGSIPGMASLEGFFKGPDGEPLKLDREATLEAIGAEAVRLLPRGIFATKGGASADEIAARFGFDDGKAFLEAIKGKDFVGALRDETKKRIDEKYGPALVDDPQRLEGAARDAVQTEAGAKKLWLRLNAIARELDPTVRRRLKGMSPDAIREVAQETLWNKPIRLVSADRYAHMAQQNAERGAIAWEEGKKEKALEHVESQLWNHVFALEARELRAEVDRAEAQLRGTANPAWRAALGKATADLPDGSPGRGAYRDFSDAILSALRFGPPRSREGQKQGEAALDAALTQQLSDAHPGVHVHQELDRDGNAVGEPLLVSDNWDSEAVREFLRAPRKWSELTPAEALSLRDAVKNIRASANERNEVKLLDRSMSRADLLAEMRKTASAALPEQPTDTRSRLLRGKWRDARLTAQAADGMLLTVRTLVDMLAGKADDSAMFHRNIKRDSIFHQAIWDPYLKAKYLEAKLADAVMRPLREAYESLPKEVRQRAFEPVQVGDLLPLPADVKRWGHIADDGNMARSDLWTMLLNMGSGGPKGNKTRLLGGYGWEERHVWEVLQRSLSKEEFDWAQRIWDVLDTEKLQLDGEAEPKTLFERLSDLHERETGLRPEKIPAAPFHVDFADGTSSEYRGGYFPARYDPRAGKKLLGIKQEEQAVASMFGESYRMVSVVTGHAQKRAANYQDVVNLDWSVLPSHLGQVLHDLSFRSYVKQTAQLLLQPELMGIFKERLGEERALQFKPWLQVVANGRADAVSQVSARAKTAMGWVRGKALMQALGYNLAVPLLHVSNPLVPMGYGLTGVKDTAKVGAMHAGYWPEVLKNLGQQAITGQHLSLALAKSATHWGESYAFAHENSPLLQERESHWARRMRQETAEMGGELGKQKQAAPIRTALREAAFTMIDWMDKLTATPVWLARYWQSIEELGRKGYTEDDAHAQAVKDADDVVYRVLPQHTPTDQPAVLNDRLGLGSFFMAYGYMSRQYQLRRGIYHEAYLALHDPEKTKGDVAVTTAKVIGTLLASCIAHQILGDYVAGRGPEEGDEDLVPEEMGPVEFRRALGWFMRKDLTADLGTIPLLGPAADILAGKKVSLRQAPGIAVLQDSIGRLADIIRTADGDKELEHEEMALQLAELLGGYAFGIPVNQVHKTGRYVKDVASGSEIPRGPGDVAAGLIYGKAPGDNRPTNPFTNAQDLVSGE